MGALRLGENGQQEVTTLPIYAWLMKLASNKAFRLWLLKQGPHIVRSFKTFLAQAKNRESAIRQAEEIKGDFSIATIDGQRHVIVWREGRPFSAFPPVEGDLEEKLQFFDRSRIKNPQDLTRRKLERRVQDLRNRRMRNKSAPTENRPSLDN